MSNFKDFIRQCETIPGINKNNLYFSQTRDGYSCAYKPRYPTPTEKDFVLQTIDKSGAYLRGKYEIIAIKEGKASAFYFCDFDDLSVFISTELNI